MCERERVREREDVCEREREREVVSSLAEDKWIWGEGNEGLVMNSKTDRFPCGERG